MGYWIVAIHCIQWEPENWGMEVVIKVRFCIWSCFKANNFISNLLNHLRLQSLFTLYNCCVSCSLDYWKSKLSLKVVFLLQSFLVLTVRNINKDIELRLYLFSLSILMKFTSINPSRGIKIMISNSFNSNIRGFKNIKLLSIINSHKLRGIANMFRVTISSRVRDTNKSIFKVLISKMKLLVQEERGLGVLITFSLRS